MTRLALVIPLFGVACTYEPYPCFLEGFSVEGRGFVEVVEDDLSLRIESTNITANDMMIDFVPLADGALPPGRNWVGTNWDNCDAEYLMTLQVWDDALEGPAAGFEEMEYQPSMNAASYFPAWGGLWLRIIKERESFHEL